VRWFIRWYGANPLHLLVTIACFAIAGYAADKLRTGDVVGILVWLGGAVVGHDLILVPLYTIADRSVMAVFRRRPPAMPAVPWINYLRVPVVLSAILLLIWWPLIFRLPTDFTVDKTGLSLDPYLGRWLAVTGALFLLSAAAFALRLRPGRRPRGTVGRGEAAPRPHPAGVRSELFRPDGIPEHPGAWGPPQGEPPRPAPPFPPRDTRTGGQPRYPQGEPPWPAPPFPPRDTRTGGQPRHER
jgi:hypothetical protein